LRLANLHVRLIALKPLSDILRIHSQQTKPSREITMKEKREVTTERKDMMSEITDTAQNLIDQGNSRRVLARADDGRVMFDVPLTYVVAGGAVMLFLMPGWGWLIALGAVAYGFANRIKLELVRELSDEDDSTIPGRK